MNEFLRKFYGIAVAFCAFLATLSLVSCHPKGKNDSIDYSGFYEKTILLAGLNYDYEQKDTLAFLTIKIPSRLDTFYRWQHFSDCSNCGYSKYRFSDKRYPQYPESGFFYSIHPDSTYQFNIWHKPFREVPDTITLKPLSKKDLDDYLLHLRYATDFTNGTEYLIKEFKIINGKPFAITAFFSKAGYLTWKPSLFVNATTVLKSRELRFIAECSAKDTSGFIANMYKSILSIRIQEKN